LHTPQDLNSPQAVAAILDFIGVNRVGEASLPGVRNRTPGYETILGDDELRQCRDVIAALPATYLEDLPARAVRGAALGRAFV
jgi:hypothetical protein